MNRFSLILVFLKSVVYENSYELKILQPFVVIKIKTKVPSTIMKMNEKIDWEKKKLNV